MLKLLCKTTGNVFTLPDDEAMRIMNEDWEHQHEILDCGFQEESSETVTPEEAKRLEEEKAKRVEEEKAAEAAKEQKKAEKQKKRGK